MISMLVSAGLVLVYLVDQHDEAGPPAESH